jgi:methyl-accepting chemotaxis protein
VVGDSRDFTVFRIDFKATISLENEERQVVLIEIQKAKLDSDIVRFRKYLGSQYMDSKNAYSESPTKSYPLYTIYFLGHELVHSKHSPIINVNREYIDNYTKEKLTEKEEFIECLTHNSTVVQIPLFKKYRRNRLEKLLSIFEASTRHEVEAEEMDDEEYKLITRRLIAANSDSRVRLQMDVEDEIIHELANKDRVIADTIAEVVEAKEQLIEVKVQLGETAGKLEETEGKLEETAGKLEETAGKLEETAGKLEETAGKLEETAGKLDEAAIKLEETEASQREAIRLLNSLGISNEVIAERLNISIEKIRQIV